MTSNEFIELIKNECKERGVVIKIGKGKYINYGKGFRVSGYFSTSPEILAFATKHKGFLETLVHESCHMDQWYEKDKVWQISAKYDDDNVFDNWITQKDYPLSKVFKSIDRIQLVELDCEKRSVKKIKKYDLPIDIKQYIKRANSYLFLYTFIKVKRKWPDKGPYYIKQIVDLMPDKFLKDYSYLSPELCKLYEYKCYKK